jgi:hypothetical protein
MHSEGGVMNWVIGVLCLVIGAALVYVAMPNKEGINPAFARSGFMQMLIRRSASAFWSSARLCS